MVLPGSERADFPCTLIHQALTPSPLGETSYMNFVETWIWQLRRGLKMVHGPKRIFHLVIYVRNLLKNHQNDVWEFLKINKNPELMGTVG